MEHIPVFLEGQDDLAGVLATAMCSICYNTESFIDFYVLDCGISSFNKKLLNTLKTKFTNFSLEFIPIDLKQFDGMKGWPPLKYQFLDCYARLLIPELKPDLNRAIYLDSDIIALGDIGELWAQDLNGFALGAVADNGYEEPYLSNCINNLNVDPKHIYANAGVLLIDCEKWRQNDITGQLLKIGRENKDHLIVINEDILSVYFSPNQYQLLDNRFNLADLPSKICKNVAPHITDEYMAEQWRKPIIYHFCHGKPFRQIKNVYDGRALRHFDSFWFFAQMTPFYAGLEKKIYEKILEAANKLSNEELEASNKLPKKETYKLFGFFPLMTVRKKYTKIYYKLFGIIPVIKKSMEKK